MSQMINYNGEMIRINPTNSKGLYYSKNEGRTWSKRN